jgi:hypothetical protein
MKLNKTQARLLTEARRHPLGLVATYGTRDSNAAQALRDAGLFEHLRTHHTVRQLVHGFGANLGTETIWRLK